jgi:hypothetical protein
MYSLMFMIFGAAFFYQAADMEDGPRVLWTLWSLVISLVTWQVLRWGALGMMLGQVGLFVGITVLRANRER